MIKKDPFRVFSLSVYSLGVCAEQKKRPGAGTQVLTSLWECNYCKIKEFIIAHLCRNPNFHLSFRLSSLSSWAQKSSTAVNGTPPPDHPRRIQLQQCLEISKIAVYLRKNNQGLSAAHLWQESRPVMKSLISPSLLYLLTSVSYCYLAFLSFCLFFLSSFLIFFLKLSLHPLLSSSCVPRSCYSTTRLWVAHMRRERLSSTSVLKTAQRPCGCW